MKRAIALLLLAACAEPSPSGRSSEGPLLIQSHTLIPMEPSFGYITRIKFVVENPKEGIDAFLVVSMEPTRNRTEEGFVFQHGSHSEGFLLPGQSFVLQRSFRVIHPSESFQFKIVRMSLADVMREWNWNEAQVENYRKFYGRIVEPRERSVPESVIVSEALARRPVETQTVEVGFGTLREPKVSFEVASGKAGKHDAVTYSQVLSGWIFKTEKTDILISANYPRTELASCPARAYREMDMNSSIAVKLDYATAKALGFETKPTGETSRTFRIDVTALRFKEFLEKAAAQGKTVRVGPTGYVLE